MLLVEAMALSVAALLSLTVLVTFEIDVSVLLTLVLIPSIVWVISDVLSVTVVDKSSILVSRFLPALFKYAPLN